MLNSKKTCTSREMAFFAQRFPCLLSSQKTRTPRRTEILLLRDLSIERARTYPCLSLRLSSEKGLFHHIHGSCLTFLRQTERDEEKGERREKFGSNEIAKECGRNEAMESNRTRVNGRSLSCASSSFPNERQSNPHTSPFPLHRLLLLLASFFPLRPRGTDGRTDLRTDGLSSSHSSAVAQDPPQS